MEGCRSICYESSSFYFDGALVNPLPRVSGRTTNSIGSLEVKMVLKASTDVRAWIMSNPPVPISVVDHLYTCS